MMMTACSTPKAVKNAEKPALVLVAFGTSVDSARQVFDYIDQQARKRYAGYDLRWAFTSQFIIDKLKKQGLSLRMLKTLLPTCVKKARPMLFPESACCSRRGI